MEDGPDIVASDVNTADLESSPDTDISEGSDTSGSDVEDASSVLMDIVDDGTTTPDVGELDSDEPDALTSDTETTDTTEQDGTPDTTPDTSVDCNYLDLGISIVSCGDGHSYLREWTDLDGNTRACPAYYTISGDTSSWGTAAEALASQSCDDSCMYVASTSVSWVRCGRRGGYIVYRADGRDCGELYELPEGLFPSIEAYNAAHPCEEP
jgi:hypothetical protein